MGEHLVYKNNFALYFWPSSGVSWSCDRKEDICVFIPLNISILRLHYIALSYIPSLQTVIEHYSHRPQSPATRCPPGWRWCLAHRVPGTPARSPVQHPPCSPLLSACAPWSARRETRCHCWWWERGGGGEEEQGWRPETPSVGETERRDWLIWEHSEDDNCEQESRTHSSRNEGALVCFHYLTPQKHSFISYTFIIHLIQCAGIRGAVISSSGQQKHQTKISSPRKAPRPSRFEKTVCTFQTCMP